MATATSYLRVQDAAEILGVAENTIYWLIHTGKLRADKQYGIWELSADDVDEFKRGYRRRRRRKDNGGR